MRKHFLFFIAFSLYAPQVWGAEIENENDILKSPDVFVGGMGKIVKTICSNGKCQTTVTPKTVSDLPPQTIARIKALLKEGKKVRLLSAKVCYLYGDPPGGIEKYIRAVGAIRPIEGGHVTYRALYGEDNTRLRASYSLNPFDENEEIVIPEGDPLIEYLAETLSYKLPDREPFKGCYKLFPYMPNLNSVDYLEVNDLLTPENLEYLIPKLPEGVLLDLSQLFLPEWARKERRDRIMAILEKAKDQNPKFSYRLNSTITRPLDPKEEKK